MGQNPPSVVVAVVVDGHPPVVDTITEMAPEMLVSVASMSPSAVEIVEQLLSIVPDSVPVVVHWTAGAQTRTRTRP